MHRFDWNLQRPYLCQYKLSLIADLIFSVSQNNVINVGNDKGALNPSP